MNALRPSAEATLTPAFDFERNRDGWAVQMDPAAPGFVFRAAPLPDLIAEFEAQGIAVTVRETV